MAYTKNGQQVDPGAFDIDYLQIEGQYGSVDITYLNVELNIIENMFAQCITGSLVVLDALNIISNLPLMEGDLIKGKLKTSESDPYVQNWDPDEGMEFVFEVIKITKQQKMKQDLQEWILLFVSTTWTDNLSNRISKSYRQLPYSDMVTDIYDTYLSFGGIRGKIPIKGLLSVATEGMFNVIIPNWKPYEAISWLSKRSFVGPAANYVFYENKDSFHFLPMNDILARPDVITYHMSSFDRYTAGGKNTEPDFDLMEKRYLSINNVTFVEYQDISDAVLKGMLGHRLIKFDTFNKRVTDYYPKGQAGANYILDVPYDYFTDFGALNHCEKNRELVTAFTNDKMGLTDANTLLSVVPDHNFLWDDQETYLPEKWKRQRGGQMAASQFVKLEVTVPGNFTRKIGEKIKIDFISPQWKLKGQGEEAVLDERFRGNYLITVVRRKFTNDRHTTIMEIIKDDYFNLRLDAIWDEATELKESNRKE